MSIQFRVENKCFQLNTEHSSYQMKIDAHGRLLHLMYGGVTSGCADWLPVSEDRGFSGNPADAGEDRRYSLDQLPQEFPTLGTGDHRTVLLRMRDHRGAYGCDLKYLCHEIRPGKYSLHGLPAVYADDHDAETLAITLSCDSPSLRVTLLYGVLPKIDVITRSCIVENTGKAPVYIEQLGSACLDMVHGTFDLISFHGRHAMERIPVRRSLKEGAIALGSRRGMSSHQCNPFMILCEPHTTEVTGRCWALQHVYSGGFSGTAEVDAIGQTRVTMALSSEQFHYPLKPGEKLISPEVILSFSQTGFSTLSQNLHLCLREHVCRGYWRDRTRPVILNSWEASYFDFGGDSIVRLAREAASLGADLLLLDDGWFGHRCDDRRSLGDWKPNEAKLGGTLGDLIKKIRAEGVDFGIWMEPEMISEDSDLFRRHPDWALAVPGRPPVRSRSQLVLDLTREDVRAYILDCICETLNQGEVTCLKWDFNRSITDVWSQCADDQGRVLYDYILGLYAILEAVLQRYPKLLIEGCSGGGGRFDAGMLYYTPQIWCSDNTDAIDRIKIQYGTSFGYPMSALSAHVSACPNHQTGRATPIATRVVTALTGVHGYELDPARLSEEEKQEIRAWIAMYRQWATVFQKGRYFRLNDPLVSACACWEYVSHKGDRAALFSVHQEAHANAPTAYIIPRGLKSGERYRDIETGNVYDADALMEAGIPLPRPSEEYAAHMILLELV